MKESGEFVTEDGVLKKYCGSGGHVVIPEGVTVIGDSAFRDCATLTGVTIPHSVDFIDRAFGGCTALTEISVDAENPTFASVDGVLFSKDKMVLYAYPGGKAGAYEIPRGVTRVGDRAFSDHGKLTHVTIPHGVRRIEDLMFRNCRALTGVVIPDSVETIGSEAFSGCVSLKRVTIPDSVKGIGFAAFAGCTALEEVNLPARMCYLDTAVFQNCIALKRVTFPQSLEHMGADVFDNCPLLPWGSDLAERRGVFWVVDGKLLAFPFREGDRVGVAKSGKTYDHQKLWEAVRPEGCKEPFDYYPRGRVEVAKSCHLSPLLSMSPHIPESLLPEIKAAFRLKQEPIIHYDHSVHYRCHLDVGYTPGAREETAR